MNRKLVLITVLIFILVGMLTVKPKTVKPKLLKVKAFTGSVTIKADGSIDPPEAPINTSDKITYILTDDIEGTLTVQRNNTIIDGAGYTLYGKGTLSRGIDLLDVNNITIKNFTIKSFWSGIDVWLSSHITVQACNLTSNKLSGLWFTYSSNNKISGNNITNNNYGIRFGWSSNNIVFENNITDHHANIAIYVSNSFNNTFYDNIMNNNAYDLEIHGLTLGHFMHSIDASNLIDGKPVYYLINQTDLVITPATFPQIGYLALINCFNATVKNLNLTSNGQGLLLAYTNNSKIAGNHIANNDVGVWLYASSNNTISRNNITSNDYYGVYLDGNASNNLILESNITDNQYGIELDEVFNNTIRGNNITDNEYGIFLWKSSNCSFCENTFSNNDYGVWLELESYFPSNKFYHNNFLDNYQHAHIYIAGSYISGHNFWDNEVEGNYWSNYTGADSDHDGIGNMPHIIDENNTDNHPLTGMFHSFNASNYKVNVISNSTIEKFEYFESNSTIKMRVSNMTSNQTFGFCRVCIPHSLMNPNNIWIVIDAGQTEVLFANLTLYDNGTYHWIYFAYPHSTHEITFGEDKVPPTIENVYQQPDEDNVYPDNRVEVYANVTDDLSEVKQVILNYTTGNGTWFTIEMENLEGNLYNATIPAFPYCTNITYLIIAEDNANNTITTQEMGYEHQYHVIPELPSNTIIATFLILTTISLIFIKRKRYEKAKT